MAKTVSDVQLSLAYRLGESAAPTNATELARRTSYIKSSIEFVVIDKPYWFMRFKLGDTTIANQEAYPFLDRVYQIDEVKVDGYQYTKRRRDEIYHKFEAPTAIVPILPSYMDRTYYLWNEAIHLIPTPSSAPDDDSATITSSSTTCTATVTAHGYADGDWVTIAGANETAYNGKFQITYVDANTFTYTALTTPSATPATGTITSTLCNITLWCYQNPDMDSFTTSSSIVVPDKYEGMITSYAEFRYWSAAHKRGKASDAEAEFREYLFRMNNHDQRLRYGS